MSVYGTSLGVALPAASDPTNWPGPDYAEQILLVLAAVKERLESRVTPAGMDIASTFSFATYAARDLQAAQFDDQSADPAPSRALYFKGNEWYAKDGEATVIKLTASGILNVVPVIGVTGAGYGAGGVAVEWDGSAQRYRFKSGAGADAYGDVEVANLDLYTPDGTKYGRLKGDAASGTFNVTFPAALPAGIGQVSLDSAGQLSVATQPRHDNISLLLPLSWKQNGDFLTADTQQNSATWRQQVGGLSRHIVVLPLRAGDEIQSLTFYGRGSNGQTMNLALSELDYTDGASPRWTDKITGSGSAAGVDDALTFTANTGAPYTLIDGKTYAVVFDGTPTAAGCRLFGVKVVYKRS